MARSRPTIDVTLTLTRRGSGFRVQIGAVNVYGRSNVLNPVLELDGGDDAEHPLIVALRHELEGNVEQDLDGACTGDCGTRNTPPDPCPCCALTAAVDAVLKPRPTPNRRKPR